MMNVHKCVTDNTKNTLFLADHYDWLNEECTRMCYWLHYWHHVVCQITMSDVMMNVHTCVTDNTIYTMLCVRSLCQIEWWMYKHVLLITLLTLCYLSDHYVWLMMNVHTRVNDNITYIMLYVRPVCLIQRWMYTHVLLIALVVPCCMSDHYVR